MPEVIKVHTDPELGESLFGVQKLDFAATGSVECNGVGVEECSQIAPSGGLKISVF